MTVKELRELLVGQPDDKLVVMSKDGEGNGYSPLSSVNAEEYVYVADTTWRGDIYLREITEELKELGYSEEDAYDGEDGVDAVILWPVS